MQAIPVEAHPYLLAAAIMAAFFFAAMVRVWLLRRAEGKLMKSIEELQKQAALQEREIVTIRQDAAAWRTEMQRQFDEYRLMMGDQVAAERKRFDDLLARSRQREFEQQVALDLAKQMCAELPAAKARVMQLEQALGIDAGEGLLFDQQDVTVSPMPDLSETESAGVSNGSTLPGAGIPAIPSETLSPMQALEEKLAQVQQQNLTLQQALAAARVRSRLRGRVAARPAQGGRQAHRAGE